MPNDPDFERWLETEDGAMVARDASEGHIPSYVAMELAYNAARTPLLAQLAAKTTEIDSLRALLLQAESALSDLAVFIHGREDEADTYTTPVALYRLRTAEKVRQSIAAHLKEK